MKKLIINQIQHFSLHDGPGIRTTVFLQGCNMRCAWCHNPETWLKNMSISFTEFRCLQCGACVDVCPVHAHELLESRHYFDVSKCILCEKCIEACCTKALEKCGYLMEVQELYEDLIQDWRLYEISGGGVTFSGGEPFLQAAVLGEICKKLQNSGIHTAVETALGLPWNIIEKAADHVDLFLTDCKIFNNSKHKKYTGMDNEIILENLKRLVQIRKVAIRVPIIKGVNDDKENAEKIAEFLKKLGQNILSVELLPYHNFGVEKAIHLGISQQEFDEPDEKQLDILRQIYQSYGIYVED